MDKNSQQHHHHFSAANAIKNPRIMAYFRPSQMIPVKAHIGEAEEIEEIEDSKQKKADGNVN